MSDAAPAPLDVASGLSPVLMAATEDVSSFDVADASARLVFSDDEEPSSSRARSLPDAPTSRRPLQAGASAVGRDNLDSQQRRFRSETSRRRAALVGVEFTQRTAVFTLGERLACPIEQRQLGSERGLPLGARGICETQAFFAPRNAVRSPANGSPWELRLNGAEGYLFLQVPTCSFAASLLSLSRVCNAVSRSWFSLGCCWFPLVPVPRRVRRQRLVLNPRIALTSWSPIMA